MRIIFKNFRCFSSKIIDIPDDNVTLLSGESGIGKSTILQGIYFVLYGTVRKPYAHDTKTCQVTLEIQNFVITRSKSPNRLVVTFEDQVYEDASAQGIIDRKFGSCKEFSTSSYIIQNQNCSLVTMSPSDQLLTLQKIASVDEIPKDHKTKVKEEIKNVSEQILKIRERIDVMKDMIHDYNEDFSHVPENFADRFMKLNEKISTLEEKINEIQDANKEHLDYISRIEKAKNRCKELEFKVTKLNKDISFLDVKTDDEISVKEKRLADLVQKSKLADRYKTLCELRKAKDENIESQTIEIKKKMEKIKESLGTKELRTKIMSKWNDVKDHISEYEEMYKLKNESLKQLEQLPSLDKLNEEIEDIEATLKIHKTKSMKCPCCSMFLIFEHGKLKKSTDNIQRRQELIKIRDEILRCQELSTQKCKSPEYYSKLKRTVKKIKYGTKKYKDLSSKLKNISFDSENILKSLEEELKDYNPTDEVSDQDYTSLKNELIQDYDHRSQKNVLEREKRKCQKEYESYKDICNNTPFKTDVSDQLSSLWNKLHSLRKTREKWMPLVDQYNRQQLQIEQISRQKELKEQIATLSSELSELEEKQTSLLTLKELILQAEVLSLSNTVKNINELAANYLQKFFNEDIEVTIEMIKNTSKDSFKTQLNTKVVYKGNIYPTVYDLSGGELQRCELAFMFAVNDLLSSNILLLDECLNNLDLDTNLEICNIVSSIGGKTIIIVSHDDIHGTVENVMRIS